MTSYFFPPEFVSDLRQRIDIVSLVSDYVGLRKAGVNYKGLCPFHGEKTPSFVVTPAKGIFHCFGCGVGGDAIAFLKRIETLSYPETVIRLAQRAGVDIAPYEQRCGNAQEQARRRDEKEELLRAVEVAQAFFAASLERQLEGPAGAYLRKRRIAPAQARRFALGLAPDSWSGLKDELKRRQVSEEVAVKAGLLIRKEGSSHCYDRFRQRLMFPIRDVSGAVTGFGGRSLGDAEPKYLNSPESPVFNKRRLLYDLYHARSAISREGLAFLVEGYMDALALYMRGIDNVIATLGTALSEDNVAAVRRYTSRVAVFFDNDKAGRAAAFRALPLFMKVGIMPEIVALPAGIKDPDDLAATLDDEQLGQALMQRRPLFSFFLREKGAGLEDYSQRLAFLRETMAMIRQLPEEALRGMALRELGTVLGVSEEIIMAEYRHSGRLAGSATAEKPAGAEAQDRPRGSRAARPEELILAALLRIPGLKAENYSQAYCELVEEPECRSFFQGLCRCEDGPESEPTLELLSATCDSDDYDQLASLYARLWQLPLPEEDDSARQLVLDCLGSLRRQRTSRATRGLDRELVECRDDNEMLKILQRKMDLKRRQLAGG